MPRALSLISSGRSVLLFSKPPGSSVPAPQVQQLKIVSAEEFTPNHRRRFAAAEILKFQQPTNACGVPNELCGESGIGRA